MPCRSLLSPGKRALSVALALVVLTIVPALAETREVVRADGTAIRLRLGGDWSGRCLPTMILSHGLGGDERALDWMDDAAAQAGFRVAVMEHPESGPRALLAVRRRGADAVLSSPGTWQARAEDLAAAVALAQSGGCRPRPFVMGGHSMGAAFTMMEAGARGRAPYRGANRFDAYIAVSPQAPGSWAFASPAAWRGIEAPMLLLTGTEDAGLDGSSWHDRTDAFNALPPGRKRLAVITGANHFELGGVRGRREGRLAADVVAEFLGHIRSGWGPSRMSGASGITVFEK
jgi:alpha-beta hydrolase superfamily lysophospholipase